MSGGPARETAITMIEAAAVRHGARVAIEEAGGEGVTYAALLARAREEAATLGPGDVVELPAQRSAGFVARCLGAWLAGAAWVPVDPGESAFRRDAIRARVREAAGRGGLAYLISTSGSSGTPKLVMVSHGGLPSLLRAQIDAFALEPGARTLWLHAPVFDASISDWGTALAAGATLVIPSPETLASPAALHGELSRRRITHVDLPPALLAYLPPEQPPPGLRAVVLGGEACPVEPLRALARRLRVVVVYGPTEATVCSSLAVVDPEGRDRWDRPRIGLPLPGVTYRVVDGELWIGGACLALGYAGDLEETARRFVEQGGMRWYRTGDLVEDDGGAGGLAFLGRGDRQAKLAGRRVELAEIEGMLRRAPGVRHAAAVVRAARPGERARLVAFVEAEPAGAEAEGAGAGAGVRAWMRGAAPAWMVPARVVVGPLPRTATGKIDHAALARCELPPRRLASHRDPLEAELDALWCDALGGDAVTGERFRDAGGDSLAALALHAAAAARGISLDPRVLDGDPTFAELVVRVGAAAPPVMTVAECERRGLVAARAAAARDGSELDEAAVPAWHAGGSPGCVLLTGATGTLGRALIRAWRARDPRPLIALVRAPDEAAARRRVDAGVEVVCGDVARPDLGLSREAWRVLAGRVAAVVHAAAHVELPAGWDAHEAANVGGTAEIARLAATAGAAWHHVSTLSVFVGTDRKTGLHAEAAVPAGDAIAYGGYAQTKLAAEAIARAERGRAAPTTIFRLGLLVSDAPRAGDQLAMTLRGLAKLGAVPAGAAELCVDLTPVAYAAAALPALALHAEAAGMDATHHVAGARAVWFATLIVAMRDAGAALVELAPDAWADRARARLTDPEIAMAYVSLGRVHAPGSRLAPFDLFLATGADFDVARTADLLAELGVAAPPLDRALVARIVQGALDAEAAP